MINQIRSLVRPIVTLAFVLAFIAATFTSPESAGALEGLTGLVVGFWFNDRAKNGRG